MKKGLKIIVSFCLVLLMLSFYATVVLGYSPADFPGVDVDEYSELIDHYNDNSKLQPIYERYEVLSTVSVTFDEFCELYNKVIESDMFIYFTENEDRTLTGTKIEVRSVSRGLNESPRFGFHLYWRTNYENAVITIEYARDGEGVNYLENIEYKSWAEDNYSYRTDYKGCSGFKKRLQKTETILLNGKECELFWEADNKAGIVYDGNKIITVYVSETEDGEGKVTKDYVREFISDLVFSEYIPPEKGSETSTEE